MKTKFKVLIGLASAVILAGLCWYLRPVISTKIYWLTHKEMEWPLAGDEVLFVENFTYMTGEVLEGDGCSKLMIDFPTYYFYPESRTLEGAIDFRLLGLKILYGAGQSLYGAAGGGSSSGLTGIYKLPREMGVGEGRVMFKKVDEEGGVWLEYRGQEMVLAPGEERREEESEIEEDNGCKKEITTTEIIKNYGILNKENIERW